METQLNVLMKALIVSFFRKKGANTPENAISINQIDFIEMGMAYQGIFSTKIESIPFIRKVNEKYWLDEQGAVAHGLKQSSSLNRLLLFSLVIMLLHLLGCMPYEM
jgi:hypothetical protein